MANETRKNASGENTGRWTKEEHATFLEGLEKHGKEWKKIANMIETRTVVQIRTHAQKYFQKLAKTRESQGKDVPGDLISTACNPRTAHEAKVRRTANSAGRRVAAVRRQQHLHSPPPGGAGVLGSASPGCGVAEGTDAAAALRQAPGAGGPIPAGAMSTAKGTAILLPGGGTAPPPAGSVSGPRAAVAGPPGGSTAAAAAAAATTAITTTNNNNNNNSASNRMKRVGPASSRHNQRLGNKQDVARKSSTPNPPQQRKPVAPLARKHAARAETAAAGGPRRSSPGGVATGKLAGVSSKSSSKTPTATQPVFGPAPLLSPKGGETRRLTISTALSNSPFNATFSSGLAERDEHIIRSRDEEDLKWLVSMSARLPDSSPTAVSDFAFYRDFESDGILFPMTPTPEVSEDEPTVAGNNGSSGANTGNAKSGGGGGGHNNSSKTGVAPVDVPSDLSDLCEAERQSIEEWISSEGSDSMSSSEEDLLSVDAKSDSELAQQPELSEMGPFTKFVFGDDPPEQHAAPRPPLSRALPLKHRSKNTDVLPMPKRRKLEAAA